MSSFPLESKPFFYIISSVLPFSNSTGGEIVLYRHFEERKDLPYGIIHIPRRYNRLFKMLESSRFRTYVKGILPLYERLDIATLQNLETPSFVLTVAHGRECYGALRAAKYWNVPLVTIFHDWYPASSDVHPWLQLLLDWEFRNLYRRSSLALCVSKQMRRALGRHPNSIVLPPIPSKRKPAGLKKLSTSDTIFLYAGFCGGAYQDMLSRFMTTIDQKKMTLRIAGSSTEGLKTSYRNVSILGFIPEEDLTSMFEQVDILLVFLNFEKKNRKHFSTHFPSKLVEYCAHGKMIAIWGPSYTTAVQWAKETKAAFFYQANDAAEFSREVLNAFCDQKRRDAYIQQATHIYTTQFDPDIVDTQLKKEIRKVAAV